ncbi:DUF4225 domain-containing protein [Pseudomonas viridiflava]|uniref:DUF4225 domain-containing protein n=1 Tax=Pseudomonas viridiflava TaxID=33069 RepID=UPI0015E484E9|nr:DUF4225 domain-containing protein [Pseudomonas viridiflava]MBA1232585.1 DUF4225 domain-containing protein [Pseudomonas viridiflava]
MSLLDRRQASASHDLWRVSQAAGHLAGQACTVSSRHIRDGTLRLQFNRDVAYYAQGIVRDVEASRKSVDEGLEAIEAEHERLIRQSSAIAQRSIGAVAGALQLVGGAGICYASPGTLCVFFGAPLMLYGGNNLYENSRGLLEDRSDVEGPVRTTYQEIAKAGGLSSCAGNIAYGTADLGMSLYGAIRLVVKPDAWKLFDYVRADRVMAYKTMPVTVLSLEGMSDLITIGAVLGQVECACE